ncbi:LPS translocon maturation chaperone LptM [Xenophilus arseniciresistens]|uniref:LPS translocon maturation chaperone LptM n=1 Tax=Xenophilus arseniciresistens TaxID=1283306 RepID=UPI002FE03939
MLAALVSVSACGQRGPLYLPTDPAAAQRATLPQTVLPGLAPDAPASSSTNGDARTNRNDASVPAAGVGAPAGGTAR